MKQTWKNLAETSPFQMAAVVLLFGLGFILLPTEWLSDRMGTIAALALSRTVYAAIGIVFMILMGKTRGLGFRRAEFRYADVALAALLVAVNNFPLVALCTGEGAVTAGAGTLALVAAECLAVGLFEEIFFRGMIFSLLLAALPDTGKGRLLAVILSSVCFGLTHLVNLLGGGSPGAVLLQAGYTMLLGAMFATVYLFMRTIWIPALVHALFNFGGQLITVAGTGEIWSIPAVILTAAVGVAVAAWLIVRFFTVFWKEKAAEEEQALGE